MPDFPAALYTPHASALRLNGVRGKIFTSGKIYTLVEQIIPVFLGHIDGTRIATARGASSA